MEMTTFLKDHHKELKKIIDDLPQEEFSSHDFIEKFARLFEAEYIEMLYKYKNTGNAFKTVHSTIAKYLSQNMTSLDIVKTKRDESEHVFGDVDIIQWWSRI